MAKARNWIVITFAVIGVIVICILGVAGISVYAVMKNFRSQPATATSAIKSFDDARAQFGVQQPLLNMDDLDSSAVVQRKIDALPPGKMPAETMEILVWSPNSERTVRITLPFWLLKLGRKKIDIAGADNFDFERLQIDVHQLERIGPMLLADISRASGERVLVWTK